MTVSGDRHDRLTRAVAAIDEANTHDPNICTFEGIDRPKELLHAERATAWVRRLAPDPSDAQLLAARAHHLRRWEIPRNTYPDGRVGYLRWRTDQKKKHAVEVAGILSDADYDDETILRVQQIIRKEGLQEDADVQVHEDALCLVFLETQLDLLTSELGDERTRAVLAKTWAKMSDRGRDAALGLELSAPGRRLVEEAVAD